MNRKTLTLFVVAVVLVILLLVFENPFQRPLSESQRKEEQVQLFLPLAEEDCSRIEISGGLVTTTTLVRKGREWLTPEGYKADPTATAQLFQSLSELSEPVLISDNPDALLKFQIDPFLGIRLRMYDMAAKPQVDLMVGEVQRDFFHTPIRRPDSNNVYRYRGMLRTVLRRRSWRDFNILRVDQTMMRRLAVRTPGESYAIARENLASPWHFSEPTSAPVDAQAVDVWLRGIANLRASDFEPTTATAMLTTFGLTDPRAQLSVAMDDGSSYTVLFGNLNPKKEYYVKRTDDPQVFRVRDYMYTTTFKPSADLRPKPKPEPPAPGDVLTPLTTATVPAITPIRPKRPVMPARKPAAPPSSPAQPLLVLPKSDASSSPPKVVPAPAKSDSPTSPAAGAK